MTDESKKEDVAELTPEEIKLLLETIAEVEREEVEEQFGPLDDETRAA